MFLQLFSSSKGGERKEQEGTPVTIYLATDEKAEIEWFPKLPLHSFPSPQKKRSNEEAAHKSLSYFIACD